MGLFKTHSEKEIKKINSTVDKIMGMDEEYQKLTDAELVAKTDVGIFPENRVLVEIDFTGMGACCKRNHQEYCEGKALHLWAPSYR